MFKGYLTALITPFRDGKIDDEAFQSFVEWQIAEGAAGIVPCGTTGESATLSHDEHMRVVELAIEAASGRVPVLAGAGSNATDEAIMLTRHAKTSGAAAALLITPYYNKPVQEGLYQHFKAIHDAVDLPIVIYNVPGRTSVDITVETVARLAELPNIIGIKDATADLERPLELRRLVGEDFRQFSGEDATVVAFLAHGGHGCISVTANVAPRLCADIYAAWDGGDPAKALSIQERLLSVHDAMFVETNPIPAKWGVHLLGRCREEIRLPMTTPSPQARKRIETAMREAGLLS
ncbi:MAG: 4-hydroxy-tetrahydrodipicolinate synthase [Alphaproteobacteria bacterium]